MTGLETMILKTFVDVGINAIGGAMQGNNEAQAIDKANKLREEQAKATHERNMQVWEINNIAADRDYVWKQALVAAQRYQEKVKETDYNANMGRIIDTAIQNLQLNGQALQDTYILEEQLRAKQVVEELGTSTALRATSATADILGTLISSQQLKKQTQIANKNSTEAVRQYMIGVRDKAKQARQLVNSKEEEGAGIVAQLVNYETMEKTRRDMQYVQSLVAGSKTAARLLSNQGGSKTAKRAALNSLQQFGRTYGEMQARMDNQQLRLSTFNASMKGTVADQMGRLSLAMNNDIQRIKYTRGDTRRRNKLAELQQSGLYSQAMGRLSQFQTNVKSDFFKFNQLTVPGFELASRAGSREMAALINQTVNNVQGAMTPYRPAIYFDPLEPIYGLKPEYIKPLKQSVPGTGAIVGQAIMEGVGKAMNNISTDAAGNIQFG